MHPSKVQSTEINNYRRELELGPEITDEQLRNAIAEVEPWLIDDSFDRQALLIQAIVEPGSTK